MAKKTNDVNEVKLYRPDEIKAYLDQYVVGQDEAKKTLAVTVYNHYKRLINNGKYKKNVDIDKSNMVLLGNTGCGKTLMIKTIAKMLGVPCYIQDCTKITASGYVGSDVEDCIAGLLRSCNYDMRAVEMGIIMLDEGDKIAKKGAGPSITRDVSGECVQQSLLKIVEGDVVGVPPMGGRKHPEQQLLYVDTTNILFILSGAFVGLEDIIKKRLGGNSIGFNTERKVSVNETNYNQYATANDLREFGMIPEFTGRFPIISHVNPLSEEDLVLILKEPKNSLLKQYQALMKMDNAILKFSDDALNEIAHLAFKLGTGARGLRSIIETVMEDTMFDTPKKISESENEEKITITITKEDVIERTKKKYSRDAV